MGTLDTTDILTANDTEKYFDMLSAPNKEAKISREIWSYLLNFYENKLKSKNPAVDTQVTLQNSRIGENEEIDISGEILEVIKKTLGEKQESIETIKSGHFVQETLILTTKKGEEIVIDLSGKTLESLIIKHQAKKQINSLQETLGKVALIGTGLGLVFYDVLKDGTIRAKTVTLTVDGQKVMIDINKNFTSLLGFESEMYSIIEKKGLRFNTRLLAFEWTNHIDKITMGDIESVQRYTYKQYEKDMKSVGQKEILSELDFEKSKADFLVEMQKLHTQYGVEAKEISFGRYFTQSIGEKIVRTGQYGLGVFLFPIFFKHMHQENQDFASVLKTANEMAAFGTGAKLGMKAAEKISNPVGRGIGMILLPLFVGGIAITGTHIAGEKFDIDWWYRQNMPESEDFLSKTMGLDDSKSIMAHILTGGVLNDVVDSLNLDTWFYNTSINFAENPRVYLSQRVNTKDLRNQRVDDFRDASLSYLESFYSAGGVFERLSMVKSNIEKFKNAPADAVFLYGKEAAIKEEEKIYSYWKEKIIKKIVADVNPFGNPVQNEAQIAVLNLFTYHFDSIISGEISKQSLETLLTHYINKLKITPEYLQKLQEKLDGQGGERYRIEKALNGEDVSVFKQQDLSYISGLDQEKRDFIKKVFGRLQEKKKLLDTPGDDLDLKTLVAEGKVSIMATGGIGASSIVMMSNDPVIHKKLNSPTKDQILWKELMEEKKFYVFFLRILNYKREKEFLTNMQQYGSAEKWGDGFDQFLQKYDPGQLFGVEQPFWYREK